MTVLWPDIGFGLAAGLALGALQFTWLWRSLQHPQGLVWRRVLRGAAARILLIIAGFWLVAQATERPGLTLLAAASGLLLARVIALRVVHHPQRKER